ncbi:UDP-N-acetylglucosamine/UDP-glucose/GDP-mannose transporter [Halotydeus destructor]|nr:UDP-N-acetylglucosamine/UDP-glucose/GDP-mannose transporter [Halotydeus destructor]
MKVLSALFYGFASFLIIVVNKIVLTNYRFPSFHFLGIGQMLTTIIVLQSAKTLNIISFPDLSQDVAKKIFPLPLLYLGNLVSGLGGTKKLSLPMFTVLRRASIMMTMVGEYYILSVVQSRAIVATVVAMIGGAIIAALNDLAFDLVGYTYVLSNDFFTAANGVYMKKKLDAMELGKFGLMFYNSLFMLLPLVVLTYASGDFERVMDFEYASDMGFLVSFASSCFMGFLLMYATVLCTSHNSALTTAVVGCLKNILVTYVGMYIGGDYVFSMSNFIGVNISMMGSLVYSYITFVEKESRPLHPKATLLLT